MLFLRKRETITLTFTRLVRFAYLNVCHSSINNGVYDAYVTPSLNKIASYIQSENEDLRLFHVIWMLFAWDVYPFPMSLDHVRDFYATVFERDVDEHETEALETFRKAIFSDTVRLAMLHCKADPVQNVEIWKQHFRTIAYLPTRDTSSA